MPQVDDIRRLWSERQDISEIARMTGHDCKTTGKACEQKRINGMTVVIRKPSS